MFRGVVFVGRGLIRGGTTVQLTCCISSILFFIVSAPTKTTPQNMKKRMEEMQQVSCTVVSPLIKSLPTKTTPLNMKKRMEEM
jgi:hypothetical protein